MLIDQRFQKRIRPFRGECVGVIRVNSTSSTGKQFLTIIKESSMYKTQSFKKKMLVTAVASAAMASFAAPSFAQDEAVEEVVVTGIRASLERAMDVKRNSAGVVDAINAEDMGKFPDTNLAESLQRITGVSISRANGEGSQITVRGFGAENNMITLNGRTMPAANTFNGDGGGSRAFDFANLASEGVSGVEVYKTGKANITTGGIGATVNIKTAKPLDRDGFVATIGAKAVMDTTNRTGDDVTPEVAGLVSWANDSSTFGIALSVSHQERDSGTVGATVNDWNIRTWDSVNAPARMWNNANTVVTNAPDEGQLYARFNDLRYEFTNTERTRDNGQLTVQLAPTDEFKATLDYTFAENEIQEHLGQTGNWMQTGSRLQEIEFDNSTIATPIYARETYSAGIDEGFEQQWREQTNTLESIGLNLNYQVNDALNLRLDVHDSEMHSRGTGPFGTGSVRMALGAPTVVEREWFFGGEFPTYLNRYDDTMGGANGNGVVDNGDVSSTMLNLRQADQKSTVTQVQFDGTYEFDNGKFDFGLEVREMEANSKNFAAENVALGNWNAGFPGEFGELVQPFDIQGEFDDWNPRSGGHGFIANAADLYAAAQQIPRYQGFLPVEMNPTVHNTIQEDTKAAYFQFELTGNLGDMPFTALAGVRYETTDVYSESLASQYNTIWEDNNDVAIRVDGSRDAIYVDDDNDYDSLLPSLDVTLNISDDLVGRFSTSKTIARAGLGSLGASASGFGGGGGSTLLGAVPTATSSNPKLLPLESTNFDVSLEWYYDDASYVSFGLFEKNVINFLGSEQVNRSWLGIRDATAGPRAQAARTALQNANLPVNDDNLHGQMVYTEFAQGSADWAAQFGANTPYTATNAQNFYLANRTGSLWNIVSRDEDPLTTFRTNTPNNGKEAKIHGAEIAVQHFFGDTGFGVQANYTIVRDGKGVGFDNEGSTTTSQFALVGLSDTANLVAIYEMDQFQARIAYNWRDEYLNETSRGGSANPRYIEAYSQIDLNVSYDITDNLTVSFEGLNVTGENSRSHGRNYKMMWDMYDLGARYQVGARYSF
jgi:TonB-dependent receptor